MLVQRDFRLAWFAFGVVVMLPNGFAGQSVCDQNLTRSASLLPATAYRGEIRTDAEGNRTFWLKIPAASTATGAAAQATERNLGAVAKIPAGTVFYHWASDASISKLLAAGGMNETDLATELVRPPSESDLEGGGFYVSTDPTNSINYGTRAISFSVNQELTMLTTGPFSGTADTAIAVKNAGVDAIQEADKPSWYNFLSSSSLTGFKELDKNTTLKIIAKKPPDQGIVDLLLYDQRYPVAMSEWPADLLPAFRGLVAGGTIADSDKALLSGGLSGAASRMMFFFMSNPPLDPAAAASSVIRQTPLFVAADKLFKEKLGQSIETLLDH